MRNSWLMSGLKLAMPGSITHEQREKTASKQAWLPYTAAPMLSYYVIREQTRPLTLLSVSGEGFRGARIWAVNARRWQVFERVRHLIEDRSEYRTEKLSAKKARELATELGIPLEEA